MSVFLIKKFSKKDARSLKNDFPRLTNAAIN